MPLPIADKSKRAVNYFIDSLVIYGFFYFYTLLYYYQNGEKPGGAASLGYAVIILIYYIFFEYSFQQTPGKMISKTRVVDLQGKKPSFGKILLRTLFRLSPFDILSYTFGMGKGQHDYFSKTVVVDEDKPFR